MNPAANLPDDEQSAGFDDGPSRPAADLGDNIAELPTAVSAQTSDDPAEAPIPDPDIQDPSIPKAPPVDESEADMPDDGDKTG
ncbi:hypothetical protein [Pseudomonas indica]|uniref:Uncharacterized protein n=1 Tax=Pseudomonas indica TaxID=137658 RepID=A0A1G9GX91_9PSED|nr:hypothetical protein [Pseudomonas indica]MBU3056781.1 hypothetical protein [Pseudomonas indica]SDL05286.1 hypothetical protein SAMN05216186_11436 [Pseudomonas indica]